MSSIEDAFADNNNRRSPLEGTGDDQVQRKRGEHDDDDYYIDITQYCMNGYSLLYNERHQNPCEVARILLDTCEADYYPLYPLGNSTSFPPVAFRQASLAACSMPVYNLIQGCAACQHEGRIETTRWAEYVARCMNGATTKDGFPLEIPSTTVIPEWAFVDNSAYGLNIQLAFKQVTSNRTTASKAQFSHKPTSSSTSPTSATSATTSSSASTSLAADTTPPAGKKSGPVPTVEPPMSKALIASIVVVTILALGIFVMAAAYIRRKRRTRRQGRRLGSTADLVEGNPPSTMAEKDNHVSLFLPTESFLSSRGSQTSFTTNSASSRSMDHRASLGVPSTFYATSGYSDDDDDDSLSPFSDIHRPPPGARLTTRSNIHAREGSISTLASRRSRSAASHATFDAMSLLSATAPSSTGATYGREHDFDDESDEDAVADGQWRDRRSLASGRDA